LHIPNYTTLFYDCASDNPEDRKIPHLAKTHCSICFGKAPTSPPSLRGHRSEATVAVAIHTRTSEYNKRCFSLFSEREMVAGTKILCVVLIPHMDRHGRGLYDRFLAKTWKMVGATYSR